MAEKGTPESGFERALNWAKRAGQTPLFGGEKPKEDEKQGLAGDIFLVRWAKGARKITASRAKGRSLHFGTITNAPDSSEAVVERTEAEAAKVEAETKQQAEAEAVRAKAEAETAKAKAETKQQAE
ncbi:hypothetical protein ACFLVI_02575, partial [Chloroflexota bacterium]